MSYFADSENGREYFVMQPMEINPQCNSGLQLSSWDDTHFISDYSAFPVTIHGDGQAPRMIDSYSDRLNEDGSNLGYPVSDYGHEERRMMDSWSDQMDHYQYNGEPGFGLQFLCEDNSVFGHSTPGQEQQPMFEPYSDRINEYVFAEPTQINQQISRERPYRTQSSIDDNLIFTPAAYQDPGPMLAANIAPLSFEAFPSAYGGFDFSAPVPAAQQMAAPNVVDDNRSALADVSSEANNGGIAGRLRKRKPIDYSKFERDVDDEEPEIKRARRKKQTLVETEDYFCEGCNRDMPEECKLHALHRIPDNPEFNPRCPMSKAEQSAPVGWVKVGPSRVAGKGVWALRDIAEWTCFGPYGGPLKKSGSGAEDSGYSWKVQKVGGGIFYVDGIDENNSNWMRYVNCPTEKIHENLVAFSTGGDIWYKAVKRILKGQELFVWYGDEYGEELQIDVSQFHAGPSHLEIKKDLNAFVCDQCFVAAFKNMDDLLAHLKKKHTKKEFCCDEPGCKSQFDTEKGLKSHKVKHSGRFVCQTCGKGFGNQWKLYRHELIHSGEKPFECKWLECGRSFNDQANLNKHVQEVHKGLKPFVCPVCGEASARQADLDTHVRTHTGQKPYECKVCGLRFAVSSNCTDHERSQHGHKFVCKTCGKGFQRQGLLDIHEVVHSGEKPFECKWPECGESFNRQGNLDQHVRDVHEELKPFVCPVCGEASARQSDLDTHVRIHTGQKPYECKVCGRRFTQSSDCTKHERTHVGQK